MTEDISPKDRKLVEDLRESAKSMGVEDADRKSPEEVVDAVQHDQADSASSPSGWKADPDKQAEEQAEEEGDRRGA